MYEHTSTFFYMWCTFTGICMFLKENNMELKESIETFIFKNRANEVCMKFQGCFMVNLIHSVLVDV